MRTDMCPLSHAVTLPRELGDGTGELISRRVGWQRNPRPSMMIGLLVPINVQVAPAEIMTPLRRVYV